MHERCTRKCQSEIHEFKPFLNIESMLGMKRWVFIAMLLHCYCRYSVIELYLLDTYTIV